MPGKSSGGTKKIGRNAKKCQKYRLTGRREKNRERRAARYGKRLADAAERETRNHDRRVSAREQRRRERKAAEAKRRKGQE